MADPVNTTDMTAAPSGNASSLLKFFIADADTDQIIRYIQPGEVIPYADYAGKNITLGADLADPNVPVGTVVLTFGAHTKVEGSPPFMLFGDKGDTDFLGGTLDLSNPAQTLQATVYAGARKSGGVIAQYSVPMTFEQDPGSGTSPTPPPVTPLSLQADVLRVQEDTPGTIDVLANDSGEGTLVVTGIATQPANGRVSISNDGRLQYTPNPDFFGSDTFEYRATDGTGAVQTAQVSVTVNPVNDAPVVGNDTATVAEGQSVTIDALGNDSDPDGDPLTLSLNGQPTAGSASVVNNQIVYTAGPNDVGTQQINYWVSDGQGGQGAGTVTVNVADAGPTVPAPSPPYLSADARVNQFDQVIFHFDGNNNDPDDIAAMPVAALLTKAAGIEDKTTFLYGNNIAERNETALLSKMNSAAAFSSKLGIDTSSYQGNTQATKAKLVGLFNSGQKVLIIEGGPMEATYQALQNTDPSNLSNITMLSHSTWNQERSVLHNDPSDPGTTAARTWADIARDFPGVQQSTIQDQNDGNNNTRGFHNSNWSWLDSATHSDFQEARGIMNTAQGLKNWNPNAQNDPSDAGMLFYALTGMTNGTALDAKSFLENAPAFGGNGRIGNGNFANDDGPIGIVSGSTLDLTSLLDNDNRDAGSTLAITSVSATNPSDFDTLSFDSESVIVAVDENAGPTVTFEYTVQHTTSPPPPATPYLANGSDNFVFEAEAAVSQDTPGGWAFKTTSDLPNGHAAPSGGGYIEATTDNFNAHSNQANTFLEYDFRPDVDGYVRVNLVSSHQGDTTKANDTWTGLRDASGNMVDALTQGGRTLEEQGPLGLYKTFSTGGTTNQWITANKNIDYTGKAIEFPVIGGEISTFLLAERSAGHQIDKIVLEFSETPFGTGPNNNTGSHLSQPVSPIDTSAPVPAPVVYTDTATVTLNVSDASQPNPNPSGLSQYLKFFLVDADTDQQIVGLTDGLIIDDDAVAGRNLTVVANLIDSTSSVGSVRLTLDGNTKVEGVEPYALFGDIGDDFLGGFQANTGKKSLDVIVYENNGARGPVLEDFSLNFYVQDLDLL